MHCALFAGLCVQFFFPVVIEERLQSVVLLGLIRFPTFCVPSAKSFGNLSLGVTLESGGYGSPDGQQSGQIPIAS